MVKGRLAVSSVVGQSYAVTDVSEKANKKLTAWTAGDRPCVIKDARTLGNLRAHACNVEGRVFVNSLAHALARKELCAGFVEAGRCVEMVVRTLEG